MVPFGGHQHDWAAVELGAWFAAAVGIPLQLIGTRGDPSTGRRDASRLLGHASLALQRGLGITAEPVLVDPGTAGIVAAAEPRRAGRRRALGPLRPRGAGRHPHRDRPRATAPVVFVRRGLRPGGLAPPRALTRFTWSAG